MSLWAVIPDVAPEEAAMDNQKQSVSATVNNRHDLVERVAQEIADHIGGDACAEWFHRQASVAVNVVLEEVAQMIEARHGYGMSRQIAKEVRAMIPESSRP